MKKIIVLLFLLMPVAAFSQGFKGFFLPVNKTLDFKSGERAGTSQWLARPYFNVGAAQINLTSPVTVEMLNSLATGLSYAHFTEVNGEPYQNIAVNFMVLFGADITEVSPLELSLAVGGTIYQHLSIGVGYNFQNKNAFILTGLSFTFIK
jgi:hypothetical protein